MKFFNTDNKTAFEAKTAAQWIAFGPVIFQSARVLRNTGILEVLDNNNEGLTIEEISNEVNIGIYGVRVLLESGLGIGLVVVNGEKFKITKTGHFILRDDLTRVNMNFVNDVCYKSLFWLEESIQKEKPEGLKELGEWETVYQGLSKLPDNIQESWLEFDHFFSDDAFPRVLSRVYKNGIKNLLDIGGNTGKWAIASTKYDPNVQITIMDLPGQLEMAKTKVAQAGLSDRISFISANILDENQHIPKGFDVIWMSQFLDCFSEKEIVSILKRCYNALDNNGYILILEPFWDRQKFEAAAFCLQQTSLYFTAIANGNSQMYSLKTFSKCIEEAGFEISEQTDNIGLSQTLLKCIKR